jgi:hypothetical protein
MAESLRDLPSIYYNKEMSAKKWQIAALVCVSLILTAGCVSIPEMEKPQYSQWHYKFTILYAPELLNKSPKLDLVMSLVEMNYPAEHIEFFNDTLYQADSPDSYKDRIIREQREMYRFRLSGLEEADRRNPGNWYYKEVFNVLNSFEKGVIIERIIDTYNGGAHGMKLKRFYVLNMESVMPVKIDDLFEDYQGDKVRNIIYAELRNHSGLEEGKPLSAGIYLTDEPELSFNFFLTQEGLGFRWDPYEIAPYSEDGIEIIVPWRKIRPLMLHSGMEMLTRFNIHLFM